MVAKGFSMVAKEFLVAKEILYFLGCSCVCLWSLRSFGLIAEGFLCVC